jgi:hypothetical protein
LGRRFIVNDLTWRSVHTTRTRLVSRSAPPFSIEHCVPFQKDEGKALLSNASDSVLRSSQSIVLDPSLLLELDYWEVDPSWNGKIFCSQMQAVRPPKNEGIAPEIKIKPDTVDEVDRKFAVRLVKIDGSHDQIVLG